MRTAAALLLLLVALGLTTQGASASGPTCDDYATQAAAQQAADTRDADGDGLYCEDLPCPCATGDVTTPAPVAATAAPAAPVPAAPTAPATTPAPAPTAAPLPDDPPASTNPAGCSRPGRVVRVVFSRQRYPHVYRHFRAALRRGWPRVLVVNRRGEDGRRDRLLGSLPTKPGFDRDEYPPAVGRGRGAGLLRGLDPVGWRADVRYVPSSENRSHGASMGAQLRPYCNGTKFRFAFP